ncbi:MAG: preprotein translocase subunit SecA [bacterium]|jgi:preprotein translocase subunit SecA|nr:preprotein translocase subunit SecA [bacterium]
MYKKLLQQVGNQPFYPEKLTDTESTLDRMGNHYYEAIRRWWTVRPGLQSTFLTRVHVWGKEVAGIGEAERKGLIDTLRMDLRQWPGSLDVVARVFALIQEISHQRLGMRHYDMQLWGGWVMLNGMIAEMETGEGKTLTAVLAACTAALAGLPVHVITVNDYLAQRDSEILKPVYDAFGLRVGLVTHETDLEGRCVAYRCPVTYCTNKEVVFDYLKDRLQAGQRPHALRMMMERLCQPNRQTSQLRLRGLCYGIIDEADSILIDEARTPLIISGQGTNSYEEHVYRQALDIASLLEMRVHYKVDWLRKTLELTEEGQDRITDLVSNLTGFWAGKRWREELIHQALMALNLFIRDKEYLVRDGKVQIIDEFTGRVMADRSWEQGLHQLIEAKEGCEISTQNETLARISYQRFFRRYLWLGGMTGTAREVRRELWSIYRLRVQPIPTHRPMIRRSEGKRVYRTANAKWDAVVGRIAALHEKKRPVLVGTRSVVASEHLSALLEAQGFRHRVLNARQDQNEAEIVSQAGQLGQITIATNMAGRGTDIRLGEGVNDLGGLFVIATEPHEARRIDRQLFGRCGRQGDAGAYLSVASLEDELLSAYLLTKTGLLLRMGFKIFSPASWLGRMTVVAAQKKVERKHYLIRKELLKIDDSMKTTMAFSGASE